MSDTVTTSTYLDIDCYFVDGDSRKLKIKNPLDTVTEANITALNSYIAANNLLIGDKAGAAFGRIVKAAKVETSTTTFEI